MNRCGGLTIFLLLLSLRLISNSHSSLLCWHINQLLRTSLVLLLLIGNKARSFSNQTSPSLIVLRWREYFWWNCMPVIPYLWERYYDIGIQDVVLLKRWKFSCCIDIKRDVLKKILWLVLRGYERWMINWSLQSALKSLYRLVSRQIVFGQVIKDHLLSYSHLSLRL